jgi:hypothetical protein
LEIVNIYHKNTNIIIFSYYLCIILIVNELKIVKKNKKYLKITFTIKLVQLYFLMSVKYFIVMLHQRGPGFAAEEEALLETDSPRVRCLRVWYFQILAVQSLTFSESELQILMKSSVHFKLSASLRCFSSIPYTFC